MSIAGPVAYAPEIEQVGPDEDATIDAPRQDSWQAERVRSVDDEMRFSVWTGLAAHRPLGNINRARRSSYRQSADFRARFNACPIHEPRSGAPGYEGDGR